jgi:hypothetical protein
MLIAFSKNVPRFLKNAHSILEESTQRFFQNLKRFSKNPPEILENLPQPGEIVPRGNRQPSHRPLDFLALFLQDGRAR